MSLLEEMRSNIGTEEIDLFSSLPLPIALKIFCLLDPSKGFIIFQPFLSSKDVFKQDVVYQI